MEFSTRSCITSLNVIIRPSCIGDTFEELDIAICAPGKTVVVAVKDGIPMVAGYGGDWEDESQEGKVKKL
jgi:hypothetical protein